MLISLTKSSFSGYLCYSMTKQGKELTLVFRINLILIKKLKKSKHEEQKLIYQWEKKLLKIDSLCSACIFYIYIDPTISLSVYYSSLGIPRKICRCQFLREIFLTKNFCIDFNRDKRHHPGYKKIALFQKMCTYLQTHRAFICAFKSGNCAPKYLSMCYGAHLTSKSPLASECNVAGVVSFSRYRLPASVRNATLCLRSI